MLSKKKKILLGSKKTRYDCSVKAKEDLQVTSGFSMLELKGHILA